MPRGKKSETPEGEAATDVVESSFDFHALPGMIRLLRRPFDLGAPRYHFKSVLGINGQGRVLKKVVAPTPVKDGAGWEEWLLQDNDGNRTNIEIGYRDQAFCYTAIYPEEKDPIGRFRKAVETYLARLNKECEGMDAKFAKINGEAEKLEGEMAKIMEGGLTEKESEQIDSLNGRISAINADRFEAEKAFRLCKARIKSQTDLLERLG